MNLTGIKIGAALLLLSFLSLALGCVAPMELENACGMGFSLFALAGVVTFLLVGVKNLIALIKKEQTNQLAAVGGVLVALGSAAYVAGMFVDTTVAVGTYGIGALLVGIALIIINVFQK